VRTRRLCWRALRDLTYQAAREVIGCQVGMVKKRVMPRATHADQRPGIGRLLSRRYAFLTPGGTVRPMPIRPEHRFFYPIDWPQLSAVIRFGRAKGCCEGCGRPHGRMVYHLGDGRWWDAEAGRWRDGWGRRIRIAAEADILGRARRTQVFLAAAHRDHDTSNNTDASLAAFCQRCHMIHDRPEHQRRRWRTLFRRKALGDLFGGPYA
jgi:hypothetical protein